MNRNLDLAQAAKLVLRQWRVLLVALLGVAGLLGVLAWKVPPTYSATATVLLLPPVAGGSHQVAPQASAAPVVVPPKLINPYLSFDSSLFVVATIVAVDVNSENFKQQLRSKGETGSYEVITNGNQPSLTIVATDTDPRKALDTANAVVNGMQADLVKRQRETSIPEENWVVASPLVLPSHAEKTNSKIKVLGVVGGIGLLAAVSLTFVAESLGVGRRRSARSPARVEAAVRPAPGIDLDPSRTYGRGRTPRISWVVTDDHPHSGDEEEAPRDASGRG